MRMLRRDAPTSLPRSLQRDETRARRILGENAGALYGFDLSVGDGVVFEAGGGPPGRGR